MKNKILILAMLGVFSANHIHSDEIEEVEVQASILNVTQDKIGDPLHILSGTDISDLGTTDLGGTLDSLLGVTTSDYGTAVGQPIIRGLSGSRVKILTNGLVNRDVAGIGADHKNEVDLNDIQQIEVVRGPSSLLYANGATGGIINIVDNTIATSDIEKRLFKLGFETQSVNSGDGQSFSVADNLGGLNLYFSYSDSSFGNYDIPNGAVLHEEEHHDDEDDHDDHMEAMDEDDHDEDHDDHGHAEGLIPAQYMQQNAELNGYELQIGRVFNLDAGDLEVSFSRDVVNGELADGMNIPRLSPARNIYSVEYTMNDYLFDLSFKDVEDQKDVAEEETPTMGYQMLDTKVVKTFDLNGNSLRVSVFANNLLDEVARNHSSFVKNQVPLPGRNYGIRFNLTF